ncbi:MAG: AzlD domain-containing protein [Parasporobacterium sp.]|nr:AzlD domain-containing protein [Parasporobacterium sp.]
MKHSVIIYLLIMFIVTYAVRTLPLTLIRKQIKNRFIRSFLYYVPYVTLAVMTVPAIIQATDSPIAGALALVVGIIIAWIGGNLYTVALACCGVVFVAELLLPLIK